MEGSELALVVERILCHRGLGCGVVNNVVCWAVFILHCVEQKFIGLKFQPEVTCGTVAIIIRVVLLSPYLRIRGVSVSSIHYNQSHRVYINRRQQ